MRAAHACLRSAVSQAFASSRRGAAASFTVAAFLVPALARPAKRSFSSTRHRSAPPPPPSALPALTLNHSTPRRHLPRPDGPPLGSCIAFPPHDARGNIEEWIARLDPFLPSHLQRTPADGPDVSATVTALDLACLLNRAQDYSLDIISHVGLVQGRWPAAMWMAKKLVEDGRPSMESPAPIDPSANAAWPEHDLRSLKELTESPVCIERIGGPQPLKHTLDQITTTNPDTINAHRYMAKRALGQLWRTLGDLILVAAERGPVDQDDVMPHVLEIVALLHHMGFMPDAVYSYGPHSDKSALQPPPTLHMLSSKILTALSDASWRAHEAAQRTSKNGAKASTFLGYEVPGSRYQVQVSGMTPELWMELVLWSCLHGGWITDGVYILRQLAQRQDSHRWTLISWREILEADEQTKTADSRWKFFNTKEDTSASARDRARTHRTISGEVVTAFVDGLVNQMRVGVGARGMHPSELIRALSELKGFLDRNNLSLGSATWDSIVARLLESNGLVPERTPDILLSILDLAPAFGTEVSSANTFGIVDDEVPFFFEPTTMPLNVLHRALRAFINFGDIAGAMTTLRLLQRYTDNNKQKSVQDFFESMKSIPLPKKNEPFSSRLPPVDFPSFDTRLPLPLLANLLDLITESNLYDLGRDLLFSDDLDGPLIAPELHHNRHMAASIVRFGTMAGENDLVLNIIQKVSTWNEKHQQQRMPAELLSSLLCCQIKLRRWESITNMQKYIQTTATFRPRPVILSTFAAELLRMSPETVEVKTQAQAAFSGLLMGLENLLLSNVRNELYCILSIMSTVHEEWRDFCSQFLSVNNRQTIRLSTIEFNRILAGVVDGFGSRKGKLLVETWCHVSPRRFEAFQAPAGLQTMPKYRIGRAEEYQDRPEDLEFPQDSGTTLILQGRILPTRQTIWIIIRKIMDEESQQQMLDQDAPRDVDTETCDTLSWAAQMLHYLGLDHEDIVRDFGSLAGPAGLAAPLVHSGNG
ncbi:hypothetical protein ACN47E_008307 [Coniothyrium glycines]